MTHQTEASDEPSDVHRRRFLKGALGVAATTAAIPLVSETAAAHFPLELQIDIMPDSDENPINPEKKGVIPVAVLHTTFEDEDGKTVEFDPTKRDIRYRFGAPDVVDGGFGARPAHDGHVRDVDGDGNDDLVLHFPAEQTGFDGDEYVGKLEWERDESGEHGLSGTDTIRIVGQE